MRLVHRNIDKERKGTVVLIAEESEDMWHAYNLINQGDSLRATTIRKVHQESATGSVNVNRVRTMLTICVESTDFDTQACVLRVKGRNIEENQYVKMGGYHTLDLEINRKFTLGKDFWDSINLERIDMACDVTKKADLAAIVMQEGLAHVCLITSNMTLLRCKVEQNIPKKRKGQCGHHDKALFKFYDALIQAIIRHIDFDVVKCVLIASPGFVKDQFFEYMMTKWAATSSISSAPTSGNTTDYSVNQSSILFASNSALTSVNSPAKGSSGTNQTANSVNSSPSLGASNSSPSTGTNSSIDPARLLADNRSKFLLVHSSSGFKHSLREILADPLVTAKTSETKAAREVRALQQFMTVLQVDPDRAYYGLDHVEKASDAQAIETLLLSDSLFRSKEENTRKRCVALFDAVRKNSGETFIFSSLHVSGEQLDQISGIAAILRYPMPEIDEDCSEDLDDTTTPLSNGH